MIVCSCNVLSDRNIREIALPAKIRTVARVYGTLECKSKCGRCAHSIRKIIEEPENPASPCLT